MNYFRLMENSKLKVAYRIRFIPLIVSIVNLLIVLFLKYIQHVELEKILYYSIFFVFASFVYMQAMRQLKREKEEEEELRLNPLPPPTKEEAQQMYEKTMEAAIDQQRSNIAFRSVYLFIGILLFVLSIPLIITNKEYLYGATMLVLSILFIIYSILLLRKWIRYLKIFKEEKKKNIDEI